MKKTYDNDKMIDYKKMKLINGVYLCPECINHIQNINGKQCKVRFKTKNGVMGRCECTSRMHKII